MAAPATIIKPAIHSTTFMDSPSNQVANTMVAKGVSVCRRGHGSSQTCHGGVEEIVSQRNAENRGYQNEKPITRRNASQCAVVTDPEHRDHGANRHERGNHTRAHQGIGTSRKYRTLTP